MKIRGIVKKVIFRNDATGFTVIELANEMGVLTTVVGELPPVTASEMIEADGEYVAHRVYGKQFKANSISRVEPTGSEAIVTYLSSGLIKGVGLATAKSIVAHFGDAALDVIEYEPERLKEIPGIGDIKMRQIYESLMSKRNMQEIYIALQRYGMTVLQITRAYKLYGGNCIEKIRENPYRLIDDIENIGFKTADKIAENAGVERDSEFRIRAGIKYALGLARQEGHTCLPMDMLIETACRVLGAEVLPVERRIKDMIARSELVCVSAGNDDMVYTPYMYGIENACAKRLVLLSMGRVQNPIVSIDGMIDAIQRETGIELAPMQRQAVKTAVSNCTSVITGGPGTGKTTILKFIILIMQRLGLEYELCAPTGRAAKRMGEATGTTARTIHRMLEYGQEGFQKDEENPLKTDMVIIDEMSMVDVQLMDAFLKAVVMGTRIVMVGDVDQLPSVGAGNVLRDIIESEAIPVTRLDEVFRQSGRSMIVQNAHLINRGVMPEMANETEDFIFESIGEPIEALNRIKTLCTAKGSSGEIQVLAPMKKGVLGVNRINEMLQQALNPPDRSKAEAIFGESVYRVGDKVMQLKNNYKIEWSIKKNGMTVEEGAGVFNGDMGRVSDIRRESQTLEVLFDDGRSVLYDFSQTEELALAYCVSIHKSQGSEFSTALIPLVSGPPMFLTRNLLYTAVTRAREQVIIIGRQDCVYGMVQNNNIKKRYSGLCDFIGESDTLTK